MQQQNGASGTWGNVAIPLEAQNNPSFQIQQKQPEPAPQETTGTMGGGVQSPAQGAYPAAQPQAVLEFAVQRGDADGSHIIDNQYLFQQLKKNGANPIDMSPDGMLVTMQDDAGPYQVPVQAILGDLGYNVTGITPTNPATDAVQPEWRAVITQLPNDEAKRAYITDQVRALGHQTANVQGSGRDWYVFNPQTSQWMNVTNSPDWDMSDAVEGGMMAPRAIGSMAGFAMGGFPGMAAGGTLADMGTKGLTAALSPGYRKAAGSHLASVGADVAGSTLLDMGTMGALKVAGAGLSKLGMPALGKLATHGPISETAKMLGRGTEAVGGALKTAGGALDNPLGREAVTFLNPLTSGMQGIGAMAQLPSMLSKGAVQGAQWLGNSRIGSALLGEESAKRLGSWAGQRLLPKVPGGFSTAAEGFAARMRGNPNIAQRTSTGDVLGNLFKSDSYRRAASTFDDALTGDLSQTVRGFSNAPRTNAVDAARRAYAAGSRNQQMARNVGNVFQTGEDLGQGVMNLAMYPNAALIKGAKHGGAALQGLGRGVKNAATATSPLEPYLAARYYGSEEQIANRIRNKGRYPNYFNGYDPTYQMAGER